MYTKTDTVKYLPDKMHCKTEEKSRKKQNQNINIIYTYINVLDVRSLLKTTNECQENKPPALPRKICNADSVVRLSWALGRRGAW